MSICPCNCKYFQSIDIKTPRLVPLSAFYKRSLAFLSIKERYPCIIKKVMEDLMKRRDEFIKKYGDKVKDEMKDIFVELSDLKYELQSNKEFKPIISDQPDTKIFNDYLFKKKGEDPKISPYNTEILFAEAYLFRRLRSIFERKKNFVDYDHFSEMKKEAVEKAVPIMRELAIHVQEGCECISDKDAFFDLMRIALWANKYDLSINKGVEIGTHMTVARKMEPNVLCDASEEIWDALMSVEEKDNTIAIVLSNAGYELFCDLCMADNLMLKHFVRQITFHCKTMPMYVSDVMKNDIIWLCQFLEDSEDFALHCLGERWKGYFAEGQWKIEEDPFWHYPHDYTTMEKYAPELYEKLAKENVVFFKGDFNYRKLFGDINWDPDFPMDRGLRGFLPTKIAILRAVKYGVLCGISTEIAEKCANADVNWKESGNYGMIQYCDTVYEEQPPDILYYPSIESVFDIQDVFLPSDPNDNESQLTEAAEEVAASKNVKRNKNEPKKPPQDDPKAKAAKEKADKEKADKEKAAKEKAAKEKEAKAKEAKEKEAKAQAAKKPAKNEVAEDKVTAKKVKAVSSTPKKSLTISEEVVEEKIVPKEVKAVTRSPSKKSTLSGDELGTGDDPGAKDVDEVAHSPKKSGSRLSKLSGKNSRSKEGKAAEEPKGTSSMGVMADEPSGTEDRKERQAQDPSKTTSTKSVSSNKSKSRDDKNVGTDPRQITSKKDVSAGESKSKVPTDQIFSGGTLADETSIRRGKGVGQDPKKTTSTKSVSASKSKSKVDIEETQDPRKTDGVSRNESKAKEPSEKTTSKKNVSEGESKHKGSSKDVRRKSSVGFSMPKEDKKETLSLKNDSSSKSVLAHSVGKSNYEAYEEVTKDNDTTKSRDEANAKERRKEKDHSQKSVSANESKGKVDRGSAEDLRKTRSGGVSANGRSKHEDLPKTTSKKDASTNESRAKVGRGSAEDLRKTKSGGVSANDRSKHEDLPKTTSKKDVSTNDSRAKVGRGSAEDLRKTKSGGVSANESSSRHQDFPKITSKKDVSAKESKAKVGKGSAENLRYTSSRGVPENERSRHHDPQKTSSKKDNSLSESKSKSDQRATKEFKPFSSEGVSENEAKSRESKKSGRDPKEASSNKNVSSRESRSQVEEKASRDLKKSASGGVSANDTKSKESKNSMRDPKEASSNKNVSSHESKSKADERTDLKKSTSGGVSANEAKAKESKKSVRDPKEFTSNKNVSSPESRAEDERTRKKLSGSSIADELLFREGRKASETPMRTDGQVSGKEAEAKKDKRRTTKGSEGSRESSNKRKSTGSNFSWSGKAYAEKEVEPDGEPRKSPASKKKPT